MKKLEIGNIVKYKPSNYLVAMTAHVINVEPEFVTVEYHVGDTFYRERIEKTRLEE